MMNGGLLVLTKSNYKEWATKIERYLKEYGFWDVIEPTVGVAVDERKMYTALGCICQTLPEDVLVQVGILMDAKEVWHSLRIRFLGVDQVRKEEEEKASQEAVGKERLDESIEKERLDVIVQVEQARTKEIQETAEKEEVLQIVLKSEENERLNQEKECLALEEEKMVNLKACFPDSNHFEGEETVKISNQHRSKKLATYLDDGRKNRVMNERNDAIDKSTHVETYVKVNDQAIVHENFESNERFERIVGKKSPIMSGKENNSNPVANFGSKSDCQVCLDRQRKKRIMRKKNVKTECASEMNVDGSNDECEKRIKQVCYRQLKRKNEDGPMIRVEELRVLSGIQDLGGTIQD